MTNQIPVIYGAEAGSGIVMPQLILPGKMASKAPTVIWQPQPRQLAFLRRGEYEVLYGGAAGGGKTDASLMDIVREVNIPGYRGIIFRKTYPELEEVVLRSQEIYPRAFPGARFNDNKHVWRFPGGGYVYLGSMQHSSDRHKHQGQQYGCVIFDEVCHFAFSDVSYLWSRNRPKTKGLRVRMRYTANPGGIGHAWVFARFIANRLPNQAYKTVITYEENGQKKEAIMTKAFVPATVFDNAILMQNDPTYAAKLAMMSEADRKSLLYGDWTAFAGQAFSEWRDDTVGDGRITREWSHVINPFPIPETWRLFRSFDFGYAKPFSVGYWALDHDGCLYRIDEIYGCTSVPNTGIKWTVGQIGEAMLALEKAKWPGRHIQGVADPSIWDKSRGDSIADMLGRQGLFFTPGHNDRLIGKQQLHYRLAFDKNGYPGMYVFSNCKAFIRTVPILVYDDVKLEDIDTDGEDHVYDETRYLLMEYPLNPRAHHNPPPRGFDPLDLAPKRPLHTFVTL